MQITLTKEQVKEAFGELRFMGADNCYRYDKDSKKKTCLLYTSLFQETGNGRTKA